MANDTIITLVGNLVEDPVIRFTNSGRPVGNFRMASTPRFYDKNAQEWKDGESLFLSVSVWGQTAENMVESALTRGQRVIVQGRLKQRSYETNTGEKRTVFEVEAEEVGPSLKFSVAKVSKASRSTSGFGASAGANGLGNGPASQPSDDPWASPAASFANSSDEVPF